MPKNGEFFQSVELTEARSGAFGLSVVLHGVLLLLVVLIPLLSPQVMQVKYNTLMIVPPRHEPPPEVAPVKLPPPPKPLTAPKVSIEKIPTPQEVRIPPPAPKLVPLTAAVIPPPPTPPAEVRPEPAAPPPPAVQTNVFSSVAPAVATTTTRSTVAAGFGDTNGVSNPGRPDKTANIGKLGSFDVPPGTPGPAVKGGNISKLGAFDVAGGSNPGPSGKPGTIGKVGGFDAVAGNGGGGGPAGRPAVTDGGFGNVAAAPKTSPANSRKPVEQPEKPVEITFKPRPDYTEEARKMRIEGEVLLRVLFTSSGEARVLDVIRGLGHGLNENAIRSVGQIRFKPALQDGQPVDSTAIVHIVFQLAY